jgi:hypothetical protein
MWTIARNLLNDWYRRASVEKRYVERVGVEPRPLDSEEYERIEELADFGGYGRWCARRCPASSPSIARLFNYVLSTSARTVRSERCSA